MTLGRAGRGRSSWLFVSVGLSVVAAIVSLVANAAGPLPFPAEPWAIGVPVPLKVREGQVRVSVPTRSASDRVLVVVSSLARTPGVYPVRLSTNASKTSEVPEREEDAPRGRPVQLPRALASPPPRPIIPPPRERDFWLPARDGDPSRPGNHVLVRAVLRDHADRVAVYVDANDLAVVSPTTIRDVVTTFEEHIYPHALAETGLARDEDGDGRFTILISGWLGHLADGRLAVDGFVRGADFQEAQKPPLGNRSDMMYLNTTLDSGPHLRTVLAHEYAHAVTFCSKVNGKARADEEGWLDEAMAHLTEDAHGFSRSNLDYRVDAFLNRPERYRLLVNDYSTPELIRSHGHRGSAYSFLRWCGDHFGDAMLRTLVRSDLRGLANLEAATGTGFASLYRDWSVSLYLGALVDRSVARHGPPGASHLLVGDSEQVDLDGTSTHYATIEGSPEGAVTISVSGSPGAELQVTVVPLPSNLPRIELRADIDSADSVSQALRLRIRNRGDAEIRFESLRWFPITPSSQLDERTIESGQCEGGTLNRLLGRETLSGREFVTSAALPLSTRLRGKPLMVVVSARDRLGRQVVARAEVVPTDGPERSTR